MSLLGSRRFFIADTVADFPNAHTYADAVILNKDTNAISVSVNGVWTVVYTVTASTPDPLELVNWLSIGANPATDGAIRLEAEAGINYEDSANLDNPNPNLIKNTPLSIRNGIQLGDTDNGANYDNRWYIDDPYLISVHNQGFLMSQGGLPEAIGLATTDDPLTKLRVVIHPDTGLSFNAQDSTVGNPNNDTNSLFLISTYWDGASSSQLPVRLQAQNDYIADGGLVLRITLFSELTLLLSRDVAGVHTATFTGGILAPALPTSDPNVAGAFYSIDSAGLAAELAAGSRYLLISNGP